MKWCFWIRGFPWQHDLWHFFSFITNRFNFAQKFICSTSVNCIWFVILRWAAVRENDILWCSVLFRVKHNAVLTKLTVLLKKSCNFNSLWVITASESHLGFYLWRRLPINFKQKFTFVCHWGVYFFHNLQTADWLQMRNSNAGNRYWFPDKLIYLSLGTDKLCRKKKRKTLLRGGCDIQRGARWQVDRWASSFGRTTHIHLRRSLSIHFVIKLRVTHSVMSVSEDKVSCLLPPFSAVVYETVLLLLFLTKEQR